MTKFSGKQDTGYAEGFHFSLSSLRTGASAADTESGGFLFAHLGEWLELAFHSILFRSVVFFQCLLVE